MVCDGCSSRVEETLAKMAGVKKVGQALLTGAALCRAPSSAWFAVLVCVDCWRPPEDLATCRHCTLGPIAPTPSTSRFAHPTLPTHRCCNRCTSIWTRA